MRALLSSRRRSLVYLISILVLTIALAAGGALGASAASHQAGHGLAGSVSRGSGVGTGFSPGGTVTVLQFAQVTIDAPSGVFQFDPATLTIPKGATVVWTNTTISAHTATSDSGDPASFDSGIINSGATFSFTFTATGTYTYHCNIHTFMHGTIVVTS